ncbi:MAG: 2-C-methyl-D-erythritol 2,4-cyclodiphosphate synthase [Planctomycetes bacterium]|nr:2-C-methyl-D-erythritol 2,4-cyclodiphosphate synthase [Planctomycetota bacterium]
MGYDLHRLVPGRPLRLGCVEVPADVGPLGHSDGDALAHAVADAILGAAGAGDIGDHFPDTDPRWEGVSGAEILRRTAEIVGALRARILSVDATLFLERPRLGGRKREMAARMAEALGGIAVNVKAKTAEGLGAIGEGLAVAAQAVAMVDRLEEEGDGGR